MENQYPSNSHNKPQKPKAGESAEPKKVEKIVKSEVIQRKKPLSKRFVETFVQGDARGVWGYILFDVLQPAAKDMVADAFSQGIERMLFGEARSSSRRTGSRPDGRGSSFTSYSSMYNSPVGRREEPRGMTRRSRATHDFGEIIIGTRVEAEEVIDSLFTMIAHYEQATVADLYDLVGTSTDFTDQKWGWTDLRGAGVTRVREGYLLNLPRPEPLD